MDIKEIKELIALLSESDLTALEVEEGERKIRLERNTRGHMTGIPVDLPAANEFPLPAAKAPEGIDFNEARDITSPMVGVFYSAPEPDAKPFVTIGSRVKKGDVLCIIETMKLMNEIKAEEEGEIVDLCVSDGAIVEFGQTIFKIF